MHVNREFKMFTIQGYQANGERIESANQRPAFYALLRNGRIIEYFNSVQAARFAVDSIQSIERAEAKTNVYRIAA
jgi:hypothetical protein